MLPNRAKAIELRAVRDAESGRLVRRAVIDSHRLSSTLAPFSEWRVIRPESADISRLPGPIGRRFCEQLGKLMRSVRTNTPSEHDLALFELGTYHRRFA